MKKTLLYKIFLTVFSIIIILTSILSCGAVNNGYNWYCVHRKDHKQPVADSNISFIEKHDGYYIDKKHGDDCSDKVIYLTFDAGYENGNVEKILDTMKNENVTGAFFILGNLIDKNPNLVKRMFDEGHLVCNHTYSHKSTIGKSRSEIEAELSKIENYCKEKIGYDMAKYYRPPEGRFDETSLMHVKDLGFKTVFWSFAYADWDNNKQMSAESAKKKILDNIHNGEVMLLHPTSSTNAEILGDIIKELKNQGYRFGSLDELCNAEA